ncbi:MAG TPA: hypothetical protein VM511_13590 [Luteolibacter sp.]|nr:hypothetical protein [Luteolibacter sp.]
MPPDSGLLPVTILLAVCVGLLFFLLLAVFGINGRLGRVERLLAEKKESKPAPESISAVESAPGGPFEAFLEEDPSRRSLSKKEQSAAYRKWRQQNGMNWSNS